MDHWNCTLAMNLPSTMNKTYLLLGSNMGNSLKALNNAIIRIEKKIGPVTRKSSVYQTAAWGKTDQPDFFNQVIIVNTKLDANKLMQAILAIEAQMGRIRTTKNASRVIDIDILFFNKVIVKQPELVVPHPRIAARRFVLTPLNELSPNFKHPVLHKTIHLLLTSCKDKLDVKKF
jgi:2-amino-4-hydroxy-6-hydroxymethyldihydropteridine diphosphokinase